MPKVTDMWTRFLSHVYAPDGAACWTWTASTTKYGYGMIGKGSRGQGFAMVHRYAYEQCVGPIPEGLVIDHLCRNRRCVNPLHLEPVTNRENIIRGTGWAARHAAKTACPVGHAYVTKPNGRRACVECREARSAAKSAERQVIRAAKPRPTVCRNGHSLETFRYIGPDGESRCTRCQRDRTRRLRAKG